MLEAYFVKQDTAYWIETLNKAGVPTGPIYSIDQAFADPQVKTSRHGAEGRRHFLPRPAGDALAHPEPRRMRHPPKQGEHTSEILREMGYRDGEIEQLRKKGIV